MTERIAQNQEVQDALFRDEIIDLLYLMEKMGASGITQGWDYENAKYYRDNLDEFKRKEIPEGNIAELYENIIFDFDGVLYDSSYAVSEAYKKLFKEHADPKTNPPRTQEDIMNASHAPHNIFARRFGIDVKNEISWTEMQKQFGRDMIEADKEKPSALYPEVRKALLKLKEVKRLNPKLKLHIISAGTEDHIKNALRNEGLEDFFDELHFRCQDKSKEIASINQKGKAIMLGDFPSDIIDARKVEVSTLAVARGDRERERLGMFLPDYIVSNLDEIFELKSYAKELADRT